MARRRSGKRDSQPERVPTKSAASEPEQAEMPIDFRAGLACFFLLEIGVYAALAASDESWFNQPGRKVWENAFAECSVVIVAGVIGLWVASGRSRRYGWLALTAVGWLVIWLGRLLPMGIVAGSATPVLLTLYVGQFAFGLMVPLAANASRKTAAADRG